MFGAVLRLLGVVESSYKDSKGGKSVHGVITMAKLYQRLSFIVR